MTSKAIGETLYLVNIGDASGSVEAFTRKSPKDVALQESWFRDSIAANPELVIAPCREAGLVPFDERWFWWKTEFAIDTGSIDVLILSSYGRIGIVETKLSYNPQARREVVAQLMDYALTLKELSFEEMPSLPLLDGSRVAEVDDVEDSLRNGKFLLIIAGDELDPRAIRLGRTILSQHFTSSWDLAMVDMNLFHRSSTDEYLLVPELRGTVEHETRQTMTVTIMGESPKARVEVERVTKSVSEPISREKRTPWTIEEACSHFGDRINPLAMRIFRYFDESPVMRVEGGTGLKQATLSLYLRSTNEKIGTIWTRSDAPRLELLLRAARLLDLHDVTEGKLKDLFRNNGFELRSEISKDGYLYVYLPWDASSGVLERFVGLISRK